MKNADLPLQHYYDLSDLTQAGTEVKVAVSPEDLPKLAHWAGVDSVKRFAATVSLRRLAQNRFKFDAKLTADVVQACVVTLEPVPSRITRELTRELHMAPRRPQEDSGELTLSAGDDDVPETILSLNYDLMAPLLEEFSLAIDPYPRKAGAAFTPPSDGEGAEASPFAVLKALKDRD